jgi:hypothetical protein
MSVTSDRDDAVHVNPRVGLIQLKELLDQANKPHELRRWIFERAEHELCRVYFPLPWLVFAFPGPEGCASVCLQTPTETNPDMWKERNEIKFVRLAPKVAGQFRDRGRIDVPYFPDGLFVPRDVSVDSGLLEATTFSTWLHVLNTLYLAPIGEASHPDQNVRDCVTITVNDLFVEDSVRDDVHNHFDGSPPTEPNAFEIARGTKPTSRPSVAKPAVAATTLTDAVPEALTTAPESTDVRADDPYGLKGRSDGVYMLYLTAERCSTDPEFVSASKPDDRRKIARETFEQLLTEVASRGRDERARKSKLSDLFGKTRLNYALHLIDPEYDHNNGRPLEERGKWPPAMGEEFLAQPDARRQDFVTPMLALIIGGAEYWLQLAKESPAGRTTKQQALQQWLEDHGLTGRQELETVFAVIAWKSDVDSIPTPPKFAKPSRSRGRPA